MNRPSCYGTTAKQTPEFRNHKCINCLYLLDCVEKETMMEKQTRPDCYGTQPKPDTVLWDERDCAYCVNLESCYRVTFCKPVEGMEGVVVGPPMKLDALPCVGCGEPLNLVTLGSHTCSLKLARGIKPSVSLGTKLDQTKPRWSLLPSGTIAQVIAVLEYGAKKYSVNNWVNVPDARTRYYDAAMRHLDAWHRGEVTDEESGLPHLAHATACLLFLMWFDGKSVS